MHYRLLFGLALLAAALAACQGPPPTQIILVVTATPEQNADSQTDQPTAVALTPTATTIPATATPAASPTPNPFPTPTINQIQVAEQVFENGRMFWLQPTGQIWVMIVTEEGRGEWQIYQDTFTEGDPQMDPQITPPEGREQPQRGFGKLWRENPALREALGWAITPEFGFVTRYEYHPGGRLNENNEYVPGPGYHVLSTLYEESFRFNESDQTWQLN
jgi:hypothetical protein